MRILDLNNSYSPDGGGIRVYLHEKLDYYRRHEGDHHYAFMAPSRRRHVIRDGNTSVYEMPSLPIPGTASRFVVRPGLITALIDDFRPDIIEVGSVEILPLYLRLILRRRPAATVGFFHQDYPESYVRVPVSKVNRRLGRLLGRLAERHATWLYGGFTATFASSDFSMGILRDIGVPRLIKTPLGVDTALFRPDRRSDALRRELGVDGRKPLVLFIGRLAPEKGIQLLAEAYPRIADPRRFVLAVAGHGPLEGKLAPFFAAHPEIRRLDYRKDRVGMAELLASADLVLSLGPRETFSLVTLEAMACGTPVLAGAGGGAAELVSAAGVTGPAGSTAAGLAKAIERELSVKTPAVSLKLRAFALDRHSWERVFDGITAAYEKVLGAFRSGDLGSLEERRDGPAVKPGG
jgi:alpha-1,6-mannosyltransferase